jgi:hypothetical protein
LLHGFFYVGAACQDQKTSRRNTCSQSYVRHEYVSFFTQQILWLTHDKMLAAIVVAAMTGAFVAQQR